MECLTSRLTLKMKEVTENRMAEIIDQDRFEKQRIIECPQKSRMLLYDKNYPYYNIKEHRRLSIERRQGRGSSTHKKKDKKSELSPGHANWIRKSIDNNIATIPINTAVVKNCLAIIL